MLFVLHQKGELLSSLPRLLLVRVAVALLDASRSTCNYRPHEVRADMLGITKPDSAESFISISSFLVLPSTDCCKSPSSITIRRLPCVNVEAADRETASVYLPSCILKSLEMQSTTYLAETSIYPCHRSKIDTNLQYPLPAEY